MRKMPQILLCLTLGAFSGCEQPQQVEATVVPAPKPKVADQGQVAPSLEMEIRRVNGMMEAHFTNNTRREVGVLVGNSRLRLKPGQAGKLPVLKNEKLLICYFVDDGNGAKPRMFLESVISPKDGKRRYLLPK
jgi:hypothetical protein